MSCFFRQFTGKFIRGEREIEKFPADFTTEMRMIGLLSVESVPASGRLQPPGFSLVHQNIQIAIDRTVANAGMTLLHRQMNIFGGRMFVRVFQKVENTGPDTALSVAYGNGGIINADLLADTVFIILRLRRGSITRNEAIIVQCPHFTS